MSVEAFDVIPDKIEYWPGERMTGKVILKVKGGSLQSQGIYLKMKGGASVEIVEQTVYHSRRHSFGGHSSFGSFDSFHHSHSHVITNSFKNSESYLALESFLVGDGHTVLTVGDGEFSYPFMVQLPPRLVSSYGRAGAPLAYRSNDSRGEGDVTYHLEAGMKLVGREDLVMSKPISIHAILNLNSLSEASLVGEVEESKTFRRICFCLGCQSNPLSVKVRIPKMGYLPGETISFQVEVNNQSGKDISDITAQLVEVVVVRAMDKTETLLTTVTEEIRRGETGAYDNWQGELVVPQEGVVYPSKLGGGCSIIDLDYFIKVTVHVVGCCSLNLEVGCNVIIGTCRTTLVPSVKSVNRFNFKHKHGMHNVIHS